MTSTREAVVATPHALRVIGELQQRHGALMFYQSHGCCDGSTPMCFVQGEMGLNASDVLLGQIGGVPFYASEAQAEYLQATQLVIDLGQGSLGTFSLEDADGLHFKALSRLWPEPEALPEAQPPRG